MEKDNVENYIESEVGARGFCGDRYIIERARQLKNPSSSYGDYKTELNLESYVADLELKYANIANFILLETTTKDDALQFIMASFDMDTEAQKLLSACDENEFFDEFVIGEIDKQPSDRWGNRLSLFSLDESKVSALEKFGELEAEQTELVETLFDEYVEFIQTPTKRTTGSALRVERLKNPPNEMHALFDIKELKRDEVKLYRMLGLIGKFLDTTRELGRLSKQQGEQIRLLWGPLMDTEDSIQPDQFDG